MIKEYSYYQDNKLDFYKPNKDNFPCIIYFHGGGFVEGSRKDKNFAEIAQQFCDAGFGVFNCDYSLYPNTSFSKYMKECSMAVKFAFEHLKEFGGNGKVYLSGQSAGAHICMQLCCNKQFLNDVGLDPLDVAGWIFDAGTPFDNWCYLKNELKLEDYWVKRISDKAPLYYVTKGFKTNPMYLMVYSHDICCRPEENTLFKKLIEWYDNDSLIEYKILEGNHASASSVVDGNGIYPYVTETINFINRISKRSNKK